MQSQFPGFSYKKRKFNELSYEEVKDIVGCYLNEPLTQDDFARKFRVSSDLVSKLYCLYKKDPQKLTEKKIKEEKQEQVQ